MTFRCTEGQEREGSRVLHRWMTLGGVWEEWCPSSSRGQRILGTKSEGGSQ